MRRRSALSLVTRATVRVVFALLVNGSLSSAYAASCTAEQGQLLIDQGRYKQAVNEFTCVIDAHPTDVEGYRGRIEAQLLLGQYSNSFRDYARVTAVVTPVHPDAEATILAGYAARLAAAPTSITALTGASFARWAFFDYLGAIHLLDQLLDLQPSNSYGYLFRGSSRLLKNHAVNDGVGDLDYAIALAPASPDVHYIVADAYTYGLPDPSRAFTEATFALEGGLDTPRVHAILGSAYLAFWQRLSRRRRDSEAHPARDHRTGHDVRTSGGDDARAWRRAGADAGHSACRERRGESFDRHEQSRLLGHDPRPARFERQPRARQR